MNQITSLQLLFHMQSENFARNLYGRWDSFFANKVERVLNEMLGGRKEKLVIDSLELDLGSMLEDEFDEQFPLRFRKKLEEAIMQWRVENGELRMKEYSLSTESKFSIINSKLSILQHFLLHGTLPWNASNEHRDVNILFLSVLKENPAELKKFLVIYGHYSSLQERLVYQLKDPQLEKGAHLLEPGSGDFIVSYVKFLQVKYKDAEQPGITQSDYRNTVWFVVYAYLLTNRGSYFNKKSFVTQTMLQLAGKYNLSYDVLLQLLTSELAQFAEKLIIPRELFLILEQLQKEFIQKQYRESSINAAKFYKTIYTSLQQDLDKNIPQNSREALFSILSKAGSCRAFLQYLKEEEIIALVPVVVPNESQFVIEVAHQLEIQKEQGVLQGKAGGEFRLLKWQIIFPLLLENKTSSFNRKHFVQSVFTKVASRYNVEVLLLLEFFNNEPQIEKLDKELKNIITQLVQELQEKQPGRKKGTEKYLELYELLSQAIKQKARLTSEQLQQIRAQLSEGHFREKIISQFSKTELYQSFQLLYPERADLILSFMENLDTILIDKNLQSRNSSGFNQQKWEILFAGLQKQSFNINNFMNRLLEQAEEFYDITPWELLSAFQEEKTGCHLSYNAKKCLDELYAKEKNKWIQFILTSTTEEEKYQLIQKYTFQHPDFIKSYLQILDIYLAGNASFSQDFSAVRWRILLQLFIDSQNTSFDKQYYIQLSLNKIAAHYSLSLQDILRYFIESSNSEAFRTKGFELTKEGEEIIDSIRKLSQKNIKQVIITPQTKPNIPVNLKKELGISGKKEEVLLEKLQQQTKYIEYIRNILGIAAQLRDYIIYKLKLTFNNEKLLQLFLELSKSYATLSQADILERILKNISLPLSEKQQQLVGHQLIELSQNNQWLMQVIKRQNRFVDNFKTEEEKNQDNQINQAVIKDKLKFQEEEEMNNNQSEPIFVNNAGMVLISPFTQHLFSMLELIGENKLFKDKDAQIKAVYLLQYAVFEKMDFPEHELILNKILTGLNISDTIPQNMELAQKEKEALNSMLKAALQHWEKLKNTSLAGLREGFLQREGKLEEKGDFYELTVEEKAYDLLLDSVPWNFRMIKFPWMEKMIQVKWR